MDGFEFNAGKNIPVERMSIKESREFLDKIREELAKAIDSFPAYSRISDCLYEAISNIDTAEAFFNQEPVVPRNMEKVENEDELLRGDCPCCDNVIYSNDLYCRKCGHRLSWR